MTLPYIAPFLADIKVSRSAFTIILRWTSTTVKTAIEDELEPKKPPQSDYCIRSLTSRAWLIGLWRIKSTSATVGVEKLKDLRREILKFFAEPRKLEEGCDYDAKVSTFEADSQKILARLRVYASDATSMDETLVTKDWIPVIRAFDIITRKRLSSINYLNVSGEMSKVSDAPP